MFSWKKGLIFSFLCTPLKINCFVFYKTTTTFISSIFALPTTVVPSYMTIFFVCKVVLVNPSPHLNKSLCSSKLISTTDLTNTLFFFKSIEMKRTLNIIKTVNNISVLLPESFGFHLAPSASNLMDFSRVPQNTVFCSNSAFFVGIDFNVLKYTMCM